MIIELPRMRDTPQYNMGDNIPASNRSRERTLNGTGVTVYVPTDSTADNVNKDQ